MNNLCVGFSRVDITPALGIGIPGYFETRLADGVLDNLELTAVAFACGNKRAILISVDTCGIWLKVGATIRKLVSERTGVPEDAVFVHGTHTHTGAELVPDDGSHGAEAEFYFHFVCKRAMDAAQLAVEDMKPARVGYGIGQAPNVAFIRRYLMKDGFVVTNPGVNNSDIVRPIGTPDERVNVLRFDRRGGKTIVLVNYGNHPDVIGGCKISADWPGFVRRTVETVLGDTLCVFFNGAQGNVNHINVAAKAGNIDSPCEGKGYDHSRYIGRVITGGVLQAYDKVNYVDVDKLSFCRHELQVPTHMPKPKDIPWAEYVQKLHNEGRDADLPYTGGMLTMMLARADRLLRLKDGPVSRSMTLSGVAIGGIAFVGFPGEPFVGIGRAIKETPGWELILPCCQVNGAQGYFPMRDDYEGGGYEVENSSFAPGVAELLVAEGRKMLDELRAGEEQLS